MGGREGQQGAQLPLADGGHEPGGAQAPPPVGARRQATPHGRHGERGARTRSPDPGGGEGGGMSRYIAKEIDRKMGKYSD